MTNKIKNSILVINTGSSSVKFQVFSRNSSLELLAHGKVSDLGSSPLFSAVNERQEFAVNQAEKIELPAHHDHETALHFILNWIEAQNPHWQIDTVTHRIVHGGARYTSSVIITPEIITYLRNLCPLAPLHQPHNLIAIDIFSTLPI